MRICIMTTESIPTDKEFFGAMVRTLPFGASEQERLLAIRNPETARSSLGAALALHRLTSVLSPFDMRITREQNGKPFFSGCEHLQFNLTHSAYLAVAALGDADEGRVGVDLEFVRPATECRRIASRFFTAEEKKRFAASGYSSECFFRIWTAKEAVCKLTGEGLAAALADKERHMTAALPRTKTYRIAFRRQNAYLTVAADAMAEKHKIEILNSKEIEIDELSDRT